MRALLTLFILIAGAVLWLHPISFLAGLPLILGLVVLLWIYSLIVEDASIIDIFWGPAFVLLAVLALWLTEQAPEPSDYLLCGLVALWGLRLAWHIARRNHGKGEDPRYRRWREEAGAHWWWRSLLTVFILQGLLIWIIAAPLVAAIHLDVRPGWGWLNYLGVVLWIIGFAFEAVGDWQLARFRAQAGSSSQVMDRGLWGLTRHPNYFGDSLLWWGYFCFAAASGALWLAFSPLLMTLLLLHISGVALLESDLRQRKPGYQDYMQRVPAFLPRLRPRR